MLTIISRMSAADKKDLLESLSEIEHEQWMEWARSVYDEVSKDRQNRWDKYFIPYEELPDDVKEQDRKYARKILTEISKEH